jgi:hypothetical protein
VLLRLYLLCVLETQISLAYCSYTRSAALQLALQQIPFSYCYIWLQWDRQKQPQ